MPTSPRRQIAKPGVYVAVVHAVLNRERFPDRGSLREAVKQHIAQTPGLHYDGELVDGAIERVAHSRRDVPEPLVFASPRPKLRRDEAPAFTLGAAKKFLEGLQRELTKRKLNVAGPRSVAPAFEDKP